MLLFLPVQSHGTQIVCPEQKCSEVLKWENSKYCRKAKASRLPGSSHHGAGITYWVSENHRKVPTVSSDQAFGFWVRLYPTHRAAQLYFAFKGFQTNFEMNAMVFLARRHWGNLPAVCPNFLPSAQSSVGQIICSRLGSHTRCPVHSQPGKPTRHRVGRSLV